MEKQALSANTADVQELPGNEELEEEPRRRLTPRNILWLGIALFSILSGAEALLWSELARETADTILWILFFGFCTLVVVRAEKTPITPDKVLTFIILALFGVVFMWAQPWSQIIPFSPFSSNTEGVVAFAGIVQFINTIMSSLIVGLLVGLSTRRLPRLNKYTVIRYLLLVILVPVALRVLTVLVVEMHLLDTWLYYKAFNFVIRMLHFLAYGIVIYYVVTLFLHEGKQSSQDTLHDKGRDSSVFPVALLVLLALLFAIDWLIDLPATGVLFGVLLAIREIKLPLLLLASILAMGVILKAPKGIFNRLAIDALISAVLFGVADFLVITLMATFESQDEVAMNTLYILVRCILWVLFFFVGVYSLLRRSERAVVTQQKILKVSVVVLACLFVVGLEYIDGALVYPAFYPEIDYDSLSLLDMFMAGSDDNFYYSLYRGVELFSWWLLAASCMWAGKYRRTVEKSTHVSPSEEEIAINATN